MSLIIQLPILYSLQNCPYAIRARFAISRAKQQVLIRAIKLNNKPEEMLIASAKGSVPVLVINEKLVIDESLEIMLWALSEHDPMNLLHAESSDAINIMICLINKFEQQFIPALEAYCCAKRYHESNVVECREACELILKVYEQRLSIHSHLYAQKESLLDIALFPFIRKFARVERQWYQQSPYPKLRNWLNNYLQSPLFSKVMSKHELWLENHKEIYFGK